MFGLTLNDIVEILEQASLHNQHRDIFHDFIKSRKTSNSLPSEMPDTPLLKATTKLISNHDMQANELFMKILSKEPRTRNREELKYMHGFLHDYVEEILFQNCKNKYTDNQKDQIIVDLFKTSLRLVNYNKGHRFINFNQVQNQICIILKG